MIEFRAEYRKMSGEKYGAFPQGKWLSMYCMNLDMSALPNSMCFARTVISTLINYAWQSHCHSWIIDPADNSYFLAGVFSKAELTEIKEFEAKSMPRLPDELDSYIDEFEVASSDASMVLFDIKIMHWKQLRTSERRYLN